MRDGFAWAVSCEPPVLITRRRYLPGRQPVSGVKPQRYNESFPMGTGRGDPARFIW